MPDEEECRVIAARHLEGRPVTFDRSIFLRWDRKTVLAEQEVHPHRTVPFVGAVAEVMRCASSEAALATNLWRQVGAVVARDGNLVLAAHNTQLPSPHTPYYEGDPRMFFKRGLHFELTTDEHAEAILVGEAAQRGLALAGADLYVTTFPCPPCAKLIARAKFNRLYFANGYSTLDGERTLRENGVEIIRVEMETPGS
jgi:dCMP deaminase